MKSESNITEEDLRDLVSQIHHVGKKPRLSRRQKRAMLADIVPKRPLILQLAPTFAASFVAGVLILSGISFAAQPGDSLYGFKRRLEDIRATVQPSYNETLLQKRNNEIEDLQKNGADDSDLDIANKEKQEIENRIKSGSDDTPTSSSSSVDNDDETKQENQTSTSGGGSTSGGNVQQQTARDQCKAALDARKKAGENINSDMYKACDKL